MLIKLHTDFFIHTNIQVYVFINAALTSSHLWSFYRLRGMNPVFEHKYAKRCKTRTVLVQGELFLLQVQPPSWIEINQSEDKENQLFPMQYACPPFWIEINQSEDSNKINCFLCSTHVPHFESKSTNQRTAAKLTVSYAVRMSAILDRNQPIRGQQQN